MYIKILISLEYFFNFFGFILIGFFLKELILFIKIDDLIFLVKKIERIKIKIKGKKYCRSPDLQIVDFFLLKIKML